LSLQGSLFRVAVEPGDEGRSHLPDMAKDPPNKTFAIPGNLSNTMFQQFQN
jgi:hypothetical protein